MRHIVLVGDSIFDNASYVDVGHSVTDQLKAAVSDGCQVTMLAVDGDVVLNVIDQLQDLPEDTSHVFISCGGNDALAVAHVLSQPANNVGEVMDMFTDIKSDFEKRYQSMLTQVQSQVENITICSVHDSIPGFEQSALTALSFFNEVILKEAFRINAALIDLRLICNEASDYSSVSPIEPSKQGGTKIVEQIIKVVENHNFDSGQSWIYK